MGDLYGHYAGNQWINDDTVYSEWDFSTPFVNI